MANYEVLEPGGHAALIDGLKDYTDREGGVGADQIADGSVNLDKLDEDVLDVLDTKADIDGYYAQLTAGAADNLTGRGDTTTAEFLYRTAGGTADIETGQAVAKSVKGNTLVWNQLLINGDKWVVQPSFGTKNYSDGVTTATSTAINANASFSYNSGILVPAHKYVCIYEQFVASAASSVTSRVMYTNATSDAITFSVPTGSWQRCKGYFSMKADATNTFLYLYYDVNQSLSVGDTVQLRNPQLFDLTQMFGAGNEPSTVAEFEALFPLPYYEYDAGSLLSVNMEGIETVGFNQWDEEWERGIYNSTTGQPASSGTYVRSRNKVPVFANTEYSITKPSAPWAYIYYYDTVGNFIGYESGGLSHHRFVFTTPANAGYINFCVGGSGTAAVTTYNHDICINLSWSGRRNGDYEPYWSSQRLIDVATYFPDGMRSAGTVRDELTSTEAITRVGVVDLGTLTWVLHNNGYFYSTGLSSLKAVGNFNLRCDKYETSSDSSEATMPDKNIKGNASNTDVYVKDTAYSTASDFKTAMSGVMLYYELATPIVTPIDSALNLSYRVDDFGTERVMVPEDERSAPPVLDIAYGLNVVDFVRRAPSEYMSHASMSQFRLALMSHFGIFINETWDEVDNRYEYTITSE